MNTIEDDFLLNIPIKFGYN